MSFKDKTVLITGSAQGIGKSIAEKFASNNANIVIGDINHENAKKTSQEISTRYNVNSIAKQMDVSDSTSIEEAIADIIKKYSKIDILINNAGICRPFKPFEDIEEEEWNQVLKVNLVGTINCVKAVIPMMKERKSGKIVNIASSAGETGGISVSPSYAVSKAAIMCLTKSLAKYLGEYNINVNAVAPGIIETAMTSDLEYNLEAIPLKRFGKPGHVADTVLFLASNTSEYITGTTVDVNGGIYMK